MIRQLVFDTDLAHGIVLIYNQNLLNRQRQEKQKFVIDGPFQAIWFYLKVKES